jgi:small-conductance mechanosensitive channel
MNSFYHYRLVLLLFFIANLPLFGQDSPLPIPDTLAKTKTINLSDISRRSAKLTVQARDLAKEMITTEQLAKMSRFNDSLVQYMDSLLVVSDENLTTLSVRNLKGKRTYWELNLKKIASQESKLISEFDDLEQVRKTLKEEMAIWKSTDERIRGEKLSSAVHQRFLAVEKMIDTTLQVVDTKSAEILVILDKLSLSSVDIESFISRIVSTINTKQDDLLFSDEAPLFSLGFGVARNWKLSESMIQYYTGNYRYLMDYLHQYIVTIIIHLLFIGLLAYLFMIIRRSKIRGGHEVGGQYKQRLKIILSKPVSTAIVVGIFTNYLIYPYQPLLFMDVSRFILTFPIVILLIAILPRIYHKYVYAFGISVILFIVYLNLPTDHIISRLLLLTIGFTEVWATMHYLIQVRTHPRPRVQSTWFVFLLSVILAIISIVGVLASILGKVMLATLMAQAVIGFILVAVIISLSLTVLNGLWVLYVDSPYSNYLRIIRKNKDLAKSKVTRLFNIIAVLLLLFFMLGVLNINSVVFGWITEFFNKDRYIGSMEFTWGQVLLFFFVIWLSTVVANFLQVLLEDDLLSRVKLEKGLPNTIAMLVKYTLVTIGVFLAVSAIGLPLDSLTVIIGAFGVGIGFGLQNIFNNLVSGLILLFERPIKINDTVEVGTLIGNVRSIGIRASNIRTFDGAEIIVPNGNLISNEVINWTLSDQKRRIEVIIGVSYGSDPNKVHDILMDVIGKHKDIIKDPEPLVLFNDLGESSLDFRCLFWTFDFSRWIVIKSEIIFATFAALKAAGIEIPFPQRDLHIRSVEQAVEIRNKKGE